MSIIHLPWQFLILIISFTLIFERDGVDGKCLEYQKPMLLQLKHSLIFEPLLSSKLAFWNSSRDCCSWEGVTCNGGCVTGLDLSSEGISGGINSSSSLFELRYLQSLSLAYNNFNNVDIPSGFDKFANMTYLNLSNSGFSGQIPMGISSLKQLITLDMSKNVFLLGDPFKLESPNFQTLIRNLSKLEELYLDGIILSANGYEWGQGLSSYTPNLRVLSLRSCNISGPIDSSLARLLSLSVIQLEVNDLSATVPDFFMNFTNLTVLRLSDSGLIGSFPVDIFQLPKLQIIELSGNNLLEGFLPETFPVDSSLRTILLSNTNFSGQIPDSIQSLQMLSRLELSECNFSGNIPSSMENLTQLEYLNLSGNKFTGRVPSFHASKKLSQIRISHNNLTGQIHSFPWERYSKLVILDLRDNSLNGSIPPSIFSLPLLEKIQLSHNRFAGQFNEFTSTSSWLLNTLDLRNNKLEGSIPISVFELRGLNILSLSYNNFNGTIDASMIENLQNLSILDISFNKLSLNMGGKHFALSTSVQLTTLKLASCNLVEFPILQNQSKLSTLDISSNQIGGEIPRWLWERKSLRQLNLSFNMLVGFEKPLPSLPLDSLTILDIHSNMLQGQIPILASKPVILDYSSNNFSSFIPDEIGYRMDFTYFFSLSNNSLIGKIPETMCSALYLQVLDLSFNRLNDTIPPCLLQLEEISKLNLARNKLTGTIPDVSTNRCNLRTLDINGNQIDGPLPRKLENCNTLEILNLGNNQIIDTFPVWIGRLSTLRVLVLRSNKFHGPMQCSGSISNLTMLQIVDLASNSFNGNLSDECFSNWKAMKATEDTLKSVANHMSIFYLQGMYYEDTVTVTFKALQLTLVKILTIFTIMDLSNNNFEGDIPNTIGNLKLLYVLNLSQNTFGGQIPTSFENLDQLGSLDLSQNKLSSHIPMGLTRLLFLSFLNLSFNKLVGEIPKGSQFNTFTDYSYLGNIGLCGDPLSEPCSGMTSPKATQKDGHSNFGDNIIWNYVSAEIGFAFGLGIVVWPLVFLKRWRDCYFSHTDPIVAKLFCLQDQRVVPRRRVQRHHRRNR